jgi:hypothetical protein
VPAGAVLVGAPLQPSTARTLSLAVLGAGLTHYRSALDGAPWSEPRTLETPLVLTNLAVGAHELQVLGLNSAGVWQAEPGTVARWSVVADFGAVQLNEVLADNAGAVPVELQAPDLVELFNPGNQPLDLAGMSLSDTPERPRKFVFPPGTVLPPAGYLILYADSRTQPPGIHLGFALNKAGEEVLLYDSPLRGGGLVERVAFGAQLPGRSLGRGPAGDWTLCQPTLGAANQPLPLGDARRVRLNEWLANPGPLGGDDQIELFNPEPLPVLLNGLNLTDAWAGAARRAPIYPLTFIAAGGFVVLTADGSPDRPGHLGLALASDFGSVMLTDSAGAVLDSVLYGSQAPGLSEGRQPDGHGPILRRPMEPTLGTSNGMAPAVPLTLSGQLSALGASLNLTVVGVVPGQWYRLETRVDFNAGWTLAAEASAVGDTLTFEPLALAGAQQFLRVVSGE